jgi:LPXTG-motif cell wall-anchored protein
MNPSLLLVTVALGLLYLAPAVGAADLKAELDCAGDNRRLDTHFGRYGYLPRKSVFTEPPGVRFQLPASKGVDQTGLYSYFALGGDFEITASYELIWLPAAKAGYGVSCGIAVDTGGPGGSVSLARGYVSEKGSGYVVSRGQPAGKGIKYETQHYPAQGKAGRLALRREKSELICLIANSWNGDLEELCRVPFTAATVRKVRLFADPGGSSAAMDVRLGHVKLRAEEITGGLPERDTRRGSTWWLVVILLLLGLLGFFWWRRRRAQTEA